MQLASFERARTIALLHRFFQIALQVGRMPSLLGREVFRSRVRATPARAFEESMVFVCDVEQCLRALPRPEQGLLALCVFEDRSEWEAARVFRCTQSEISRRLGETLDRLHETFCRMGLLRPVPATLATACSIQGDSNEKGK